MNTSLTVRLIADANDIPVMYRVIEMTPGATAATTYCVLQVVRVGWDTFVHHDDWKAHKVYAPLPSPPDNPLTPIQPVQGDYQNLAGRIAVGIQGVLGTLSIAALNAITQYATQTPSRDM
jgi:hypothetical protein